jgi:hypothetical protein
MPGLWPGRLVRLINIPLTKLFGTGYEEPSIDKEESMSTEKNLKEAFAGESQANRM